MFQGFAVRVAHEGWLGPPFVQTMPVTVLTVATGPGLFRCIFATRCPLRKCSHMQARKDNEEGQKLLHSHTPRIANRNSGSRRNLRRTSCVMYDDARI
jgi:hypothetical protein